MWAIPVGRQEVISTLKYTKTGKEDVEIGLASYLGCDSSPIGEEM